MHHRGDRDHRDQSLKRLMPSFNTSTLKLISKPFAILDSFMYVSNCAL